jgi:hypothetical protein
MYARRLGELPSTLDTQMVDVWVGTHSPLIEKGRRVGLRTFSPAANGDSQLIAPMLNSDLLSELQTVS